MRKCRSCKQEIDPQATKCPHCQTDQRNWFRRHPIWTGILVLFILVVVLSIVGSGSKSNNANSVPAAPDKSNSTGNNATTTQVPVTQAAPQVLLDVSGNGSKSTQKFTSAGDWDLNWTAVLSITIRAVRFICKLILSVLGRFKQRDKLISFTSGRVLLTCPA